jgi:hypothetical protein
LRGGRLARSEELKAALTELKVAMPEHTKGAENRGMHLLMNGSRASSGSDDGRSVRSWQGSKEEVDFEQLVHKLCTRVVSTHGFELQTAIIELSKALEASRSAKRRGKCAMVDDGIAHKCQKMSLLLEHNHLLRHISKDLIEDNRDLVARTTKLIAKSRKTIDRLKSA